MEETHLFLLLFFGKEQTCQDTGEDPPLPNNLLDLGKPQCLASLAGPSQTGWSSDAAWNTPAIACSMASVWYHLTE